MIAAIRADDVNFPLFLHVLGAMLLVVSLLTVGLAIILGWRREGDALGFTRLALRTLLIGVFPSYVLMRIGAQWTEAAADYPEGFAADWIDIGYITADGGAVLTIVCIILSIIGLRKLRNGRGLGLGRAVGIIKIGRAHV